MLKVIRFIPGQTQLCFPAWTTSLSYFLLVPWAFPHRVWALSSQASASVLPNNLLFELPEKHLQHVDLFLLSTTGHETWIWNSGMIRSQPALSSSSKVCMGSLAQLWPGWRQGRGHPHWELYLTHHQRAHKSLSSPFQALGSTKLYFLYPDTIQSPRTRPGTLIRR